MDVNVISAMRHFRFLLFFLSIFHALCIFWLSAVSAADSDDACDKMNSFELFKKGKDAVINRMRLSSGAVSTA